MHVGAKVSIGVASVGHLGKKMFKIYQIHYLPLEFLKSPKKTKKLALKVPTRHCECQGMPSVGQLSHKKFLPITRHVITPK